MGKASMVSFFEKAKEFGKADLEAIGLTASTAT
jgi:hypothetical protein